MPNYPEQNINPRDIVNGDILVIKAGNNTFYAMCVTLSDNDENHREIGLITADQNTPYTPGVKPQFTLYFPYRSDYTEPDVTVLDRP